MFYYNPKTLMFRFFNEAIEISLFTAANSVILTGILILTLVFITDRIKFMPRIPIGITYGAVALIGIKLLLPFDFYFTKTIKSYVVMYAAKEMLQKNVISSSISVFNIICIVWLIGSVFC